MLAHHEGKFYRAEAQAFRKRIIFGFNDAIYLSLKLYFLVYCSGALSPIFDNTVVQNKCYCHPETLPKQTKEL